MPDLIAQGAQPDDRWRRRLEPGVAQAIGRQAGAWSTPWDERISRRHVEVRLDGDQLQVRTLDSARNPVFFCGVRAGEFQLRPGEHFVIGSTTFSLVDQRVNVSLQLPRPAGEQTFTAEELRRQPFREADKRIDALSRLPDIIRGSGTDEELFVRLVNLLLRGIDRATAVAVVAVGSKSEVGGQTSDNPQSEISNLKSEMVSVLHWDRRILATADFHPSERLIRQAVASGQSVAHVWSERGRSPGSDNFTLSEGIDWAFCTPVEGAACAGWALYITGSFGGDFVPVDAVGTSSLRDDMKFAELTAATLGGLRESRLLAARQASLGQFFSPLVMQTLGSQDAEKALAPREADVTVLFCDLRGFSSESERMAGDLFGLLARVSEALGVMTREILAQGGVIGDFHGDAAMGFWGWPLAQDDASARACRAALGIRRAFADASSATNFRVGIGLASGRAVAGKIGTADQVKVTVFGPVVNLASRLETMTRQLGAAILLDEPTALAVRAALPREVCGVRRLARVKPAGLAQAVAVHELLPPANECRQCGDEQLPSYEAALAAFEAGDWPLLLRELPATDATDPARDFLRQFVAQHGPAPPHDWDGVIALSNK